jgi:Flp pilus assembly protein TadD
MALGGKPSKTSPGAHQAQASVSAQQTDFELEFFVSILHHMPDYVDVLRVVGNLLTLKGRFAEGLVVDKRLVQLRRHDPLSHYNLACSYALLDRLDQAIECLRKALEIGYRDFRYIREDHDLENLRRDPRFETLLLEFEPC